LITNLFSRQEGSRNARVIGRCFLLLSFVASVSLSGYAQDASVSPANHPKDAPDIQKSCRNFVQSFYDWYVKRPESSRALKYRSSAFSPELFRRLKEDDEAQAKVPGDIVGMDFDPFLNGQDPGDHYVVGLIKVKGEDTCWVEIHRAWSSSMKSKEPYVAAGLVNSVGRWHFVNFYYPSGENSDFSASVSDGGLLTILKKLREDRQKAAKKPSNSEPKPGPQNNAPPSKHPKPASQPTPRN
jgi:hypothetical protein